MGVLIPKFDEQQVDDFFKNYYQDRGVVKWQGFYLSDHTQALNKLAEQTNLKINRHVESQMLIYEIERTINLSIIKQQKVKVQINEINQDGEFVAEIIGKVIGYEGQQICMEDKSFIKLEMIRNVIILG